MVDDNPEHVVLFKDFVDELGAELIGEELMRRFGTWPMYSKFYDYEWPLFHHIHHGEAACKRYGDVKPKHEHYFFPKQYNQTLGAMPISYFGFDPSVTREEVRRRLENYTVCDGRITELSRAFRIELGTAGTPPRRSARAGFAVHLRAAVELRRHGDVGKRRQRRGLYL